MRIAGIVRDSITNGVGVRDVIFFQGCLHHCHGCHNPETWALNGGYEVSAADIVEELKDSKNNVTISGGEPLNQYQVLRSFLLVLRALQGKTSWLYTGYRFEEVSIDCWEKPHRAGVEVVVDGRFEESKRDPNLRFRGSSNQRLIDLKKTLYEGEIVLWEDM